MPWRSVFGGTRNRCFYWIISAQFLEIDPGEISSVEYAEFSVGEVVLTENDARSVLVAGARTEKIVEKGKSGSVFEEGEGMVLVS